VSGSDLVVHAGATCLLLAVATLFGCRHVLAQAEVLFALSAQEIGADGIDGACLPPIPHRAPFFVWPHLACLQTLLPALGHHVPQSFGGPGRRCLHLYRSEEKLIEAICC